VNIRRLVTTLLLAAAALGLGNVATASACNATSAGAPVYVDGSMRMTAGIHCDTYTGGTYEIRVYLQGSSGGYHSVHVPTTLKRTVTPPNIPNYTRLDDYYEQCAYLTSADTSVRIKTVIENLGTGSIDTAFSGGVARPANCQ